MNERYVKSLKIVFAVKRPVSVHFIIAPAREFQIPGFDIIEPDSGIAYKIFERSEWIYRGKCESGTHCKRNFFQVVCLSREICDVGELGHREKLSTEIETPAMITASDQVRIAGFFNQDLSAVG